MPSTTRRPFAAFLVACATALGLCALAAPARAEMFLDAFVGKSFTLDSDIDVKQSRLGNDFTFGGVSFDDRSFTDPIYYGVRFGYFFESVPWFGLGIEFVHFKVYADVDEARPLSGVVGGATVDTVAPVNSLVQQFSISHGVNYLTVDALFRHRMLAEPERFPHGRLQLYGGVGLGPVIAHPETRINGVRSEPGYEVAGLGVQAFAGARFLVLKHLGFFAEYKFSHSSLDVSVASGRGSLEENSHHLVGGLTIHFGRF